VVVPTDLPHRRPVFQTGSKPVYREGWHVEGTTEQNDYPQVKTRWKASSGVDFGDAELHRHDRRGCRRRWHRGWVGRPGCSAAGLAGVDAERRRHGAGVSSNCHRQRPPPDARPRRVVPRYGRPRLICFQNCKRVRITRLRLKQEAIWCLHILYSQDVVVDGIDIRRITTFPARMASTSTRRRRCACATWIST